LAVPLGVVALALAACIRVGPFACEDDAQCQLDGRAGLCLPPGYCALPDEGCDSGYRFHASATPEDLAGECAVLPAAESSTSASEDGAASTSSSSLGAGSSSSTGDATTEIGSSSHGDGSSSGTGGACGDMPCPCTRSVATGINHTCAARDDGTVMCWGADNQGQLGQGPGAGPIPEPQLVVIPGGEAIDQLRTSSNGTCGRGPGEAVWCWGDNNNGELTTPGKSPGGAVGPTALPIAGPLGALGQGPAHTCVGATEGSGVTCLGSNGYSELGGGGTQPIENAVPGMDAIDELALGNDHSCARAAGQVWCWGRDNQGQLGQNTVTGPTPDPAPVVLPGPASHLVAGNDHTCAALDDGESVRCWGGGDLGQIGEGATNNRYLPTVLDPPLPAAVVAMQAKVDTTCALLEDGSLWCWGDDNGGALGTDVPNGDLLLAPARVLTVDDLPEPIAEFSLGGAHICARAESGRLWCWGRNTSWQLGPDPELRGTDIVELDVHCPLP
jgi:alpha-tubulin suppressor-like RCC1 family protein